MKHLQVRKTQFHGVEVPIISLEKGEEAIIVSDTHFGLKYKEKFMSKFKEFEKFLKSFTDTKRPALLVLLGDIFEFWTARASEILFSALSPLRQLVKLDSNIVYVVGNHDRIAAHLNKGGVLEGEKLIIAPDYVVLECGGKRGLLFHGHQLDWKFIKLRWIWRVETYIYLLSETLSVLPWALEWILALGYITILPLLLYLTEGAPLTYRAFTLISALLLLAPIIVLLWRAVQDNVWYGVVQPLSYRLSKGRLRGKTIASGQVRKALENLLSLVESNGLGRMDFVIFGHTHVPGLIKDENGKIIANTGGWVEGLEGSSCSFLKVSDEGITLSRWNGSQEEILFFTPF